jgi:hypothetical protein
MGNADPTAAKSIMKSTRRLYYVPSSHWDREWYLPFQHYRRQLVGLLDEVLEKLADGTLAGPFTGDGQAVLIEDYLEIRPERREELCGRMRSGQLVFGPWYVMPDEFLVSGESLIRNIRMGRELVRAYGGTPSDAGFVCDLFGHNSQMPQILGGFGIRGGFLWRGVDARGGARVGWIGADGTRLPCYLFGKTGYTCFTAQVRRTNEPFTEFNPARTRDDLEAHCREELARVGTGPGLLFDGSDHHFIDFDVYRIVREFMERGGGDYRIVHGTLDGFLDEFIAAGPPQRELRGELREPGRWGHAEDHQWLIAGTLSSRVWIKQENAACESLLCQWLEPFAALAAQTTCHAHPDAFLQTAWKWLIKNHPHDSICGCSIDRVHEDMQFRFSQCRQIAEVCLDEALTALGAAADGAPGPLERRLCLFNPLPVPRDEVIEFTVEIPADWPEFEKSGFFSYDPKPAFRLHDASGSEIPFWPLDIRRNATRKRLDPLKFPSTHAVHEVRVAARVHLPATGMAVLTIAGQPVVEGPREPDAFVPPTRHPAGPGLRTGSTRMENENLAVDIQPDGTLTLSDKRSGEVYGGLHVFEDDADAGDGWNHGPTSNRCDVISSGSRARIELECDTPLLTRFVVHQSLDLPAAFDWHAGRRADRRTPLAIESRITLRAGAGAIDIETRTCNTVDDHRLRVLFPTGASTDTWLADSVFDVVTRPVALRSENHLYREKELQTKPQQSWTAVGDERRGLAVVCAGGLLEAAVPDRPDRPIALTLYRSTRRTVMTDGEPGGQLHGRDLCFRYRIVPLAGAPDRPHLFREAADLAGGIRGIHFDPVDLARARKCIPESPAPPPGLLEVSGGAVLTSARKAGHAIETRLFNPNEEPVTARVAFHPSLGIQTAAPVDFESQPAHQPIIHPMGNGQFEIPIGPKKIVTLRWG